jgi:CubicO group peptidase (beta-lactamase class C family)
MKRIMRSLTFAAILGLLPFAVCARADRVDDYVRLRMQREQLPGLTLAVVKDGRIVKAQGYGVANLELDAPATPQTVFQIGSLTKQFTAAAILLLVQEQKIGLDDPIGKYLAGTPQTWAHITLRHLLTHTSGLPMDGILTTEKTFFADYTDEEQLQSAAELPLLASPGERYSYSNLGYNLLAMVVAQVSGKPYADFVRERLFLPAGMTATRVNDKTAITSRRAQGYLWIKGGRRICEQISPTRYLGSGSILSTVLDLARWDAALSTDTILTAASRKAMWTPMTLNDGHPTDYGFGWVISERKKHAYIHHNGAMNGFLANVSRFPDDRLTVILMVNQSGSTNTERLAFGVARLYLPALRPPAPPQPTSPVKLEAATLAAYAGRYEYYNNYMLTLRSERGVLSGQLPGDAPDDCTPLSSTSFWQEDEGRQLTILKNAAGEVTGLRVREENGAEHIAPRIGPLPHAITPQPDPDPGRTQEIEAALKAMAQGGAAVANSPRIASAAKLDFAASTTSLVGLKSLSFIVALDVTGQGIERHNAKVSQVLIYKLSAGGETSYLHVYLTPEGLITDEDKVDD